MGLAGKVRVWFGKKWVNKQLEKIDTREEREKIMTEVQVKKGLPEWAASLGALLLGILSEAMQTTDISLIFTDPKAYGKILFVAIVSRLLMQIQKPGTVVVETKDVATGAVVKEIVKDVK